MRQLRLEKKEGSGLRRTEELIGDGQSFEAGLISGVEGHLTRTWLKFTRNRFSVNDLPCESGQDSPGAP